MTKKPIIGMSTALINDKDKGFSGSERVYVNRDFVNAVIKAGGVPMLIALNTDKEVIKAQMEVIDGLIITGGNDVFPLNYGEEPHRLLQKTRPERDEFDFELIKYAKEKKIPILGVCRGMQIMNVYAGGTLYQDLSLIEGETLRHVQKEDRFVKTHSVDIEEGSLLSTIYPDEIMVNSYHHQAIKDVAGEYEVISRAKDGIVEAIEHKDYPFLLGVQWHPEMLSVRCDEAVKIFKLLIDSSSK